MGPREGIAPLLAASLILSISIALAAVAYAIFSGQVAVGEALALDISRWEHQVSERVGFVYVHRSPGSSCQLWISNDGSVEAEIKKVYADGEEAWSGSLRLEPGEVASLQLSSCGDRLIVLTSRGAHVIRG
ncbi:MAG: hypothetical protein QXL31_05850 [Thermosphaera sp.]